MRFILSVFFLFIAPQRVASTDYEQITALLDHLSATPTGRILLTQAKKELGVKKVAHLHQWIRSGRYSATVWDTCSRHILINLKQHHWMSIGELAHEWVHFLRNDGILQSNVANTDAFVWNEIAGPGGEAEALYYQCRVFQELNVPSEVLSQTVCNGHQKDTILQWAQYLYTTDRIQNPENRTYSAAFRHAHQQAKR